MHVRRFHDAGAFLDRARSFLLRDETANNLMLGIAGVSKGARPYLATVEEDSEVVACGIRTPPYKAVVSDGDAAAMECLGRDLAVVYPDLSQVFGPEPAVARLAADWERRTGVPSVQGMRLQLFEAREVRDALPQPRGRLRAAGGGDEPILLRWGAAFLAEALSGDPIDTAAHVRAGIAARSLYVWDDGQPVSMAAWSGRTARGVRLNFVYTPPESRKHGYATACVAQLTRQLLTEGQTFCCLFADVTNAAANHVYRKIGYRPMSFFSDYVLNRQKPSRAR